jgi:hypothetical protein
LTGRGLEYFSVVGGFLQQMVFWEKKFDRQTIDEFMAKVRDAKDVKTRVVDPRSGSGVDQDSVTLWIRIRIGNLDPGSGSRG